MWYSPLSSALTFIICLFVCFCFAKVICCSYIAVTKAIMQINTEHHSLSLKGQMINEVYPCPDRSYGGRSFNRTFRLPWLLSFIFFIYGATPCESLHALEKLRCGRSRYMMVNHNFNMMIAMSNFERLL